jgi:AcrR family transcriptional regulator
MISNITDLRTRLLDAAEALFSERGIRATSIRDITARARANLASVHYHFRSKDGLLEAVLERRAGPVNAERLGRLDALEKGRRRRRAVPVKNIVAAFVEPTIPVLENHPHFLRFVGRLLAEPDPKLRRILLHQFGAVFQRFGAALRKTLPHLPEADLGLRFLFLIGAMAHTWTSRDSFGGMHTGAAMPPRALADHLIEFCTAGFQAAKGGRR